MGGLDFWHINWNGSRRVYYLIYSIHFKIYTKHAIYILIRNTSSISAAVAITCLAVRWGSRRAARRNISAHTNTSPPPPPGPSQAASTPDAYAASLRAKYATLSPKLGVSQPSGYIPTSDYLHGNGSMKIKAAYPSYVNKKEIYSPMGSAAVKPHGLTWKMNPLGVVGDNSSSSSGNNTDGLSIARQDSEVDAEAGQSEIRKRKSEP